MVGFTSNFSCLYEEHWEPMILGPLSQAGLLSTSSSWLLFLSCSHVSNFKIVYCPFSRLLCLFGKDSVASCSLLASRTELRSLGWGWGSSAEKKGGWARLLQSASCRRWSHIHQCWNSAIQGYMHFFLAEKQKSSCQNRTFSKIKLLLRLAAFIDALLAWGRAST